MTDNALRAVGALVVAGMVVALLAIGLVIEWLNDRDDARLDQLRSQAVDLCSDHILRWDDFTGCVESVVKAAGEKP